MKKTGKKASDSYHHGDLRNVLLSVGARLLEEKGMEALSLRELAKVAGVSHAAPYRHFSHKEDLLAALAAQGFVNLSEALLQAKKASGHDARRQLTAGGRAYVNLALRQPEMTRLMFGGVFRADQCPEKLIQSGGQAFQHLVDIILLGQKNGQFRPGNPLELSVTVWSTVHGLFALLHSGALGEVAQDEKQRESLLQTVTSVIGEGLKQ